MKDSPLTPALLPNPRGTLQSRRDFLAQSAWLAGAAVSVGRLSAAESLEQPRPFRIAMINSEYRFKSHAYHFGRRFMEGYDREGVHHQPAQTVVRMFNDKHPANDLSGADAARFHFERCDSVVEALGGRGKVDVDAVLLVIEHGDYPQNEYGQILYPRHEFFIQIVAAFEAAGRAVPVFVDKALSYDHRKARAMVDISRKMKFGLMAGSSLPVTWRRPELELSLETPIKEGLVAFGYDRSTSEVYFFHALETLQCMMERRVGGETGVRRVTMLTGDDVWRAGDEGRWSWSLLEAALARNPSNNTGTPRENVVQPEAILVEYADGTKGAALNLVEQVVDFTFAGRLANRDTPVSTLFELPGIGRFFDTLVWNIEKFLAAGRPPYPVERTLLTSTLLDLAVHSRKDKGAPQESEFLDLRYQAPADSGYVRGRITRDP
ncbi:MAG TPA: hypothetical protein VGO11_07265 [Chthoniobacteraceae bacterium]|nr:hypothetical protein [Chthoniobacteraceae bacterium]